MYSAEQHVGFLAPPERMHHKIDVLKAFNYGTRFLLRHPQPRSGT